MAKLSQSGNAVLLLMLGLFLLGVVGGGVFLLSPTETDQKNRAAEEARAAYDEAVASLDRALNDPRNIQDSLERNHSSFECLFRATGACQGRGGAFLLYDASQGMRPLSHLARNGGVDSHGRPCTGYPSAACPLHVETVWEPVCADARCENTKSMRVKAKISLAPVEENTVPLQWTKDSMFSPRIQLSQAAMCERGGGIWASTECITPSQAAERSLAGERQKTPVFTATEAPPPEAAEPPAQYECPVQIVVQGQYYNVQWLTADRAQVSVPAMSCPNQGFSDIFVFQCAAKNPPTILPSGQMEGQWVQVEAVMAPACDQYGNPVGDGPRF